MRRRALGLRAVAVAVLGGLLAGAAVTASAATLGTVTSQLFSAAAPVTYSSAARSISGVSLTTTGSPATVTGATITITGSALADLAGQTLRLELLGSGNTLVRAASAVLATGSNLTLGTGSATATLAIAGAPAASTVTGWTAIATRAQLVGAATSARSITVGSGTFSVTPPPPPPTTTWQQALIAGTGPNTAVSSLTLDTATTVSQCITVNLTGTRSNPERWSLQLDYSKPPFYGTRPTVDARAIVTGDAGGILSLVGIDSGNSSYDEWSNNWALNDKRVLPITFCIYDAPPAPNRTEAYTVSGLSQGTWTNDQACLRRTVTGNGTYPFFFGWSIPMDMTTAIARLRQADAGAPRALVYQPSVVTPAAYTSTVSTYTLANARDTAISGTQSRVVELCVSRY